MQPPQGRNPQSALSTNLCSGLKELPKGSELVLVLLLPSAMSTDVCI